MALPKLDTILLALRDQLRSQINGIGDYNYDLSDQQIVSYYVPFNEATVYPLICLAASSQTWEDQTIGTPGTAVVLFIPAFEIDLFGYVMADSMEDALPEANRLLSDVERAILYNEQLSNKVFGLRMVSSVGSLDRIGVFHMVVSGKY